MADPTAPETPHEFDLVLERTISAPAATLYRCYTEPELVCQWFCPKPWKVTEAKLDLRPGGASYHRMEGPDGEVNHVHGQYLEVVPGRRLVGTDAYVGDWVPAENSPFMTSIITFRDLGDGTTLYRAVARHWSEEAMKGHEAMGFHEGWGKAADQLEELAKSLPPEPVRVRPANPGDAHEVVPHLVCRGAAEAIAFYKQAFDAEEMIRLPGPDGRLVHASMKINTGMVMLVDEFPDMEVQSPETLGGTSVTLHLAVTDAQGVFDKAVAAGAKPLMPVARQFWGDLYGMIEDPFGHKWSIATPGENAPRTTEALQDAMMADAAS